jgi:glycosyltransferase involved in cell wall biosynthesis
MPTRISVIIPALNEEQTIAEVVRGIASSLDSSSFIGEILAVDNGSTDNTANRAAEAGATVIHSPQRGYGRACHSGVLAANPASTVFVFLDGDGSDVSSELPALATPVLEGRYDFVIGSRIRGHREPGSLLASQVFAGWLAGVLIRLRYGVRYSDMGPFRAISRAALESLQMSEMTYGWNLEMQVKAAQQDLRIQEIAVDYRCRSGGLSKVSGNFAASLRTGMRIFAVLLRTSCRSNVH